MPVIISATGNGHRAVVVVAAAAVIVITVIVQKSERKHSLSNHDGNSNIGNSVTARKIQLLPPFLGEPRSREVQELAQGHTMRKRPRQERNLISLSTAADVLGYLITYAIL